MTHDLNADPSDEFTDDLGTLVCGLFNAHNIESVTERLETKENLLIDFGHTHADELGGRCLNLAAAACQDVPVSNYMKKSEIKELLQEGRLENDDRV